MTPPARVQVVLHPHHIPGLPAALGALDGLAVSCPDTEAGVRQHLDGGAPVLVTMRWDDAYLTGGLRWVQAITAGVEQFPLEALRDRGIVLTSARGAHAPSVALHAWALLLATVRGVGLAMRGVGSRRWQPGPAFELAGRTLAVLGLGAIGEEVGRLAAATGMRVVGTKRRPEGYSGVAEEVFGPEGTREACARADAVVVTLPASPETEGVVGLDELRAIGEGWLVNVGRGTTVDEDALVTVLRDGPLRGAGLDVAVHEPLPADSPLWDLPNVVLTPHMAWSSDRLPGRLAALVEDNVAAYLGERPWVNRIV